MQPQKKVNDPPPIKTDHYYRCMPNLFNPEIHKEYLIDFYGQYIQFFSINDFSLQKRIPLLEKQDKFCAQLGIISDQIIIIFGAQTFTIFNLRDFSVVEKVKVGNYIQKSETRNSHVVIVTTDEDTEAKIVNCWKINPQTGKISQKYKATEVLSFEDEECTEQNFRISIILSIDKVPKIYLYWENTNKMIQVDPIKQQSEQYIRNEFKIKFIVDLNEKTYAEITDNKINVHSKEGGKRIAQLINEKEEFLQIFSDGSNDQLYTTSNLGLKQWKLESNSQPVFYNFSDKYKVQKVYFLKNQEIVGINNDSKNIVIWKNPNECQAHNFPNQIIRKIVKINEKLAVFLLEVTSCTKEEDQEFIYKYNKLEVYDFFKDTQVSKKTIMQTKFTVDMDSLLVTDENIIRFIVNEEIEDGYKKYIFKWTPFVNKDEKDTKKKEIKDAQSFDVHRLYPFNRLLAIGRSKNEEGAYSLFNKGNQAKTKLAIYDFGLKKLGHYDLNGNIQDIEISEKGEVITILKDVVNIYSIKTGAEDKNFLEKVNQLDIAALSLKVYKDYLLVRKQSSFLLLDEQFSCLMREQVDEEDKGYRLINYSDNGFLLKTEKTLSIWDHFKESTFNLEIPECQPYLFEYISDKLFVVDHWIQAFDVRFS